MVIGCNYKKHSIHTNIGRKEEKWNPEQTRPIEKNSKMTDRLTPHHVNNHTEGGLCKHPSLKGKDCQIG